jgi:hypothetical protein
MVTKKTGPKRMQALARWWGGDAVQLLPSAVLGNICLKVHKNTRVSEQATTSAHQSPSSHESQSGRHSINSSNPKNMSARHTSRVSFPDVPVWRFYCHRLGTASSQLGSASNLRLSATEQGRLDW